ncbi:glycosyltransferase family 2 protein [Mariniflexile gromovii]|uniref:Glycosyltransferase family 2 protein n=1 Tax=Mariniflexile gromovii TaxID=362523 RepID=A0ABS4BT10_9FLAO|nr:glycosyltransferase family A protein [Mariniflexile gromovii]MBP0903725.1 glycosyltransferase family 2 protein [Mariniflexile gromovii]
MFSIGIPAYKAKDLKECIDSILIQTYNDFELIIVNDCSPDPIDDIVAKYDDARIQYHKNEKNFGALHVVDNWNKCLSFAKGEYFILMGDDDKMEPDYLEEFVNLIKTYASLDVWHCRSTIIDQFTKPLRLTPINPCYEDEYDYIINCLEGRREQFVSDFVYRTSALVNNGGYYKLPLGWASDYLTSFILSVNKGIAHTNKPVFNYRSHSVNITSTGNLEKKREAFVMFFDWIEKFLSEKPQDEMLLLKHKMLRITTNKAYKSEKLNIIRSEIGSKNIFSGLLRCFNLRKKYNLTLNDFYGSVAASFLDRSNKK